jgi:type I restriction enzyme, S subunit
VVIADGWNQRRVGDCLTIRHGKNQSGVVVEEGRYPILATGGVIGWTNSFLTDKPSVLIGRKGTIDRPQYMDQPFWTVDTLFYSDVHETFSAKFLYFKFQLINWRQYNEASGVPSLSASRIENIEILMPSGHEQIVIARALTDVDVAIESLEALIAKKQNIRLAVMEKLLTGRTRIPGFSDNWQRQSLGQIASIKTGSRNNQDKNTDGQYPFFVRSAQVEAIDSYSYNGEAILIPGEGGIGEIFHYINGPHEVHQRVYRISDFSSNVNAKFVYFFIRSFFGDHAMRNTVKATVDSLRLPTFLEFSLHLPSLKEQNAIAETLTSLDDELVSLNRQVLKLRMVKQGMMQDLLTGKVRLV